jgi:hypothetical protein
MKKPAQFLVEAYQSSQNQSMLAGYFIIVLMMGSLAAGIAQLGTRINPQWNGIYLVAVSVFASIEAMLVRQRVKDLEGKEKFFFRASEWIAFGVIIKLLTYVSGGPDQLLRDIPRWQENFLESFFNGEYLLALAVTAAVWLSSGAYAAELESLFDRERDASWDELGKLQNALRDIRNRIASRVFVIGAVVVALAIFSRVDASAIFRERGLPPPGYYAPVANVLVYFILALVLLSQTQFALMRTRWLFQRLPISPKIAQNWIRYGFLFFLLLAVVVFFLPTEYSLGFFETLAYGLNYLMQAMSFLLALLLLPITFCMSLFSFFSSDAPQARDSGPMTPPPPVLAQPNEPVAWLEFLRSLLFWGIFVGIIFFAFRYYFLQNKALMRTLTALPLVRWLGSLWGSVWGWLRGANRQLRTLVRQGVNRINRQRGSKPSQILRRLFNPARLSPREKIIHYYLSLVQLAGERGLNRQPSQTPYQYENQLTEAVPEIDQELHNLTDTFIEARYSHHPLDEPNAEQASSLWERIRAALKSWHKNGDA